MFLITCNTAKQLLLMSYCDRVTVKELKTARNDLKAMLTELAPGFKVLADFSRLEKMSVDCAEEIGIGMELIDQHDVSLVVRVFPDPRKDIGLNILTVFHYKKRPRIETRKTITEAAKLLAL